MRGFIAINTDNHFKENCADIQNQLKKLNINGKFIDPEFIHLTLRFFHEVDEETIKKIMNELEETIKEDSFPIEIHRLMAFIKRGKSSVVWLDVDKNIAHVKHLAKITQDITDKYHLSDNPAIKFKAHFTLLRTKLNLEEEKILPEKLAQINVHIKTKVKNIVFYKSELTSKGSVYTKLYEFALK